MIKSTVSIDLGNSMIKACMKDKDNNLIKAKLSNTYATSTVLKTDKSRAITLKTTENTENTIVLGVGDPNNNILKHTRKYLLEQSLVMINELNPLDFEIYVEELKIGIPAQHFLNDAYVEQLKAKFTLKKWIDFNVDDNNKRVYIANVKVYAEGYSAFFSYVNQLEGYTQDLLLLDIGGGTTDIAKFVFDYEDNCYTFDSLHTITKGNIDITNAIAIDINNDLGMNIQASKVDSLIRHDIESIKYKNDDIYIKDYIKASKKLIESMLNEITDTFEDTLDSFLIVGVGGGYKAFDLIANEYIISSINIDPDTMFYANALGYLEQ